MSTKNRKKKIVYRISFYGYLHESENGWVEIVLLLLLYDSLFRKHHHNNIRKRNFVFFFPTNSSTTTTTKSKILKPPNNIYMSCYQNDTIRYIIFGQFQQHSNPLDLFFIFISYHIYLFVKKFNQPPLLQIHLPNNPPSTINQPFPSIFTIIHNGFDILKLSSNNT